MTLSGNPFDKLSIWTQKPSAAVFWGVLTNASLHRRKTSTPCWITIQLTTHDRSRGSVFSASWDHPPTVGLVAKIYDPDKKVSVVVYSMERFAQDCVNVFCELSECSKSRVGSAPTPFLDESNDPLLVTEELPKATQGASSAKAGTAGGRNGASSAQAETNAVGAGTGKLSNIACKVLMKIMYIARFARPDLLRAVGALSTMITR